MPDQTTLAGSAGRASTDAGSAPRSKAARGRDWQQVAKLLNELPPHAIEAEMSLLGSVFLEPQVLGDILLVLRSGDDFFDPANGRIFDVMVELYDRHSSLDIVQLNQVLHDRDILNAVGGLEYLIELAQSVPSAANATHYARLVREKSSIRSLINAAGEILHEAYTSADEPREILESAERRIYQIAQQTEQTHAVPMDQLVLEVLQLIEENDGRLVTGVPSGYADLDEMTQGLQPGEMIILAARPSMGKTALALNLTEQIATAGHPVAVFSLEMSRQQLVQRLISARSGVDSQRIRRAVLGREEWERLRRACSELHDSPIFIDDTPGLSMMQMRAKARRLRSRHDIKAIIIDYLQLMTSGRRAESRQVEISEISRSVKAMARELEVPVICLSQLNRAAEQREGHRPRMSDLRESGSIEQDADVVLMLHREEYYHQADPTWREHNPDKAGLAELIIAKQRNGPTGTVRLTWVSEITRFRDWTGMTEPDGWAGRHHADPPREAPPRDDRTTAPRSAFHARPDTGPVANFRDGSGPIDAGPDADDEPPF
ncbi:MAG: replicative DNA helicase [Phycisphaeraceae bacterium]|nr:replicative DNA helicase [Phycisphaeraceae bacterium]